MGYAIVRTDKADDQLYAIVQYIADDSGHAEIALLYLEKLERVIGTLADSPDAGAIPRYAILKKQGYRVLSAERHLVFYKLDDERRTATVCAVVDGRREYRNLI